MGSTWARIPPAGFLRPCPESGRASRPARSRCPRTSVLLTLVFWSGLCAQPSSRTLSLQPHLPVCQGVRPPASLWVLCLAFPSVPFSVCCLPCAPAAPQRPVRENSTFLFFLARAICSCSTRAVSPTLGLAYGDCLEVASRVRASVCVNFRVHREVEIEGEKESS